MNEKDKKKIKILDCTLRDGSYSIDYQFTVEDTAVIVAGLQSAGFELIEIGHGLGLGASQKGLGVAAATDEEYLKAARQTLKKAKYGMFCIPGIAELKDIELAAKYRMDFIRIGTDVTDVEKSERFIKRAKELGMFVSANLMKSYAVPPKEFAKKASLSFQYGADCICVVDSAGGMLPEDVRSYVQVVKNETGALVGFHGHDNLCLAVCNSLEAIKAGASIVDASLRGMGRSAGNAQTAILVILLEKMGYQLGIDLYKTLDLGERVIKSMVGGEKGVDSISAILGAAQFHSSFMKIIDKFARIYQLDSRELITEVSKIDRVKVNEELVERVSQRLKPAKNRFKSMHFDFDVSSLIRNKSQMDIENQSRQIVQEMTVLSKKTGRQTIFTLARSADQNKKQTTFPFIRHNAAYIIGNAEIASDHDATGILKTIDGCCDYILIDYPLYKDLERELKDLKSIILPYNDTDAQLESVLKWIHLMTSGKKRLHILVTGDNYLAQKLIFQLTFYGHFVLNDHEFNNRDFYGLNRKRILKPTIENMKKAEVILGLTPFTVSIGNDIIKHVNRNAILMDAGPGSIDPKAIVLGMKKGLSIYRIDMRAGLFGEIETVLKTYYLQNTIMGRGKIAGVPIVSGGVIGQSGDIVVDSAKWPTRIIGVADGKGGLLRDFENNPRIQKRIKKVKVSLAKAIFQAV